MQRIDKNPDLDFSAGCARSHKDRSASELQRLASDRGSWSKPLDYGTLLTDPSVQSRIARIIVHSAIPRPRYSAW